MERPKLEKSYQPKPFVVTVSPRTDLNPNFPIATTTSPPARIGSKPVMKERTS